MSTRHRFLILAVVFVAGVLSLSGCTTAGDGDRASGGSVSAAPSSATPGSEAPGFQSPGPRPSSAVPPPLGPTGGVSPIGELTLTGELQEGVEPGCVVLRTGDKLYVLIGGDRSKMQGSTSSKVTVTGKPEPGLMTTCQQGTPFRVTEMRPA
jgi:hypothetical protein